MRSQLKKKIQEKLNKVETTSIARSDELARRAAEHVVHSRRAKTVKK